MLLLISCPLSIFAQNKTLTGTVRDAIDVVIGASVTVKGDKSIGTITDMDGNFSLEVAPNSILVVSFIGYKEQQIPVNNQKNFTIKLAEDSQALDEVVVVGYGTQKKANLTGAVASVSAETLESRPITNLSQGLQGMIGNLNISADNGAPGKGYGFNVRGTTSINSSGPLVLVDGVQMDPNMINPADVESVSVLKDAASAALYGARGANGVIMIQTKKGNAEKSTLSVKAVWGFSSRAIPEYSRIGIKDYYETSWEAYRNALVGTGQSMEKASEYAAANLILSLIHI